MALGGATWRRPAGARRRIGAWALALAAATIALAGCASLPANVERPASRALPGDGTALARIAAAGRPASAAELSGFRFLPTGNYAFNARIALADRAERSIDAQYYLLQDDTIGRRFVRALRDAALRGVRVRLLVDDLYSGADDTMLAGLAAMPHVEVRLYNPLPVRGGSIASRVLRSFHEFERVNHRMHNKLFVADNALAVTGGRNIADEYFMVAGAANFIDMDVIASGPVVHELSAEFDTYWNSVHVFPIESVAEPRLLADREAAQRRLAEQVDRAEPVLPYYERDPFGHTPVEEQLAAGRLEQAFAAARVFADPPDKAAQSGVGDGPSAMMKNTLQVIGSAQQEVVVISPYFIPGSVGMPMIRKARAAGVRLVLFTNALSATDEPLVYLRYTRYREEMVRLGVEVYELSGSLGRAAGNFGQFGASLARLHAKMALIDRRFVFIGSMNLDGRSAVANTEMGLVIDSPALAADMIGVMARDNFESVLRVRLSADGKSLEWVATDRAGRQTVYADEPDPLGWPARLKLWLQSILTNEELL